MTQTNVNPISQVGLAQAILSDKEISPRILRMLAKETVSLDIGRYFSCKKLIGRYINDTLDQKIPFYEDDLMSMSDMIWAYENSPDNLEDTPF